jgi:hypothetical protein
MAALALHAAAGCWGCGGCDDAPAVPFKLSAARRGSYANPAADPGSGHPPASAAGTPLRTGPSFAADTRQIELGGRALAISEGAIRAALEVDLDADGAPELLLWMQGADGSPTLAHTRQGERGWALPEPVSDSGSDGSCVLQAAAIELLDPAYAVARAELDCQQAEPAAGAPPAPDGTQPAAPGSPVLPPPSPPSPEPADALPAAARTRREQHLSIVALERTPRVLERVVLPVPADGKAAHVLGALHGKDLDADGHSDLVLGLTARGGGLPETRVDIELWSRAGGLSIGSREPEATLLALADRARTERKRNPARAGELAQQVLALHAALCREAGGALLRVGAAQGLPCGASLAAGRAASVHAAVLAAQGKLLEAIEVHETLKQPAFRLTDNDWERAKAALSERAQGDAQAFRAGPSIATPAAPAVRRAAIAFLDEQRLLLRGEPARSYDLGSGEVAPIGMPGDTVLRDPSGRLAIAAVQRSCQGYQLSIVAASQIALGVVAGPSAAEPLISAAPPPPGARCPQPLSPEQRRDRGGFAVLAWTAQGVVLARGQGLWLLPLDAAGRAAAPASELAPGAPIAGLPPHSSELTPDGRYHALLTPLGVAIHDRQQGGARLVALPEGGGAVTDIAVSPSGRRVAIVRGGRVHVSMPPSPQAAAGAALPPP